MREDATGMQVIDKPLQDSNMSYTIRRVASDENVHISRAFCASTVTPHDLDPELRINSKSRVADCLIDLLALVAGDAGDQVFVEFYPKLLT